MSSFTRRFRHASALRKVLLVAVVVVLVVFGMPVLAGMAGMGTCEDCGPAPVPCQPSCAAIPAALTVLVLAALGLAPMVGRRRAGLVYAWSLDPPPRLA
jgi:hypothetical protein